MRFFFLVLIAYIFFTLGCIAYENATEDDYLHLTDVLLDKYKSHVRPITDQFAAMNISLDFNLISIFDVDDIKQVISVMATTIVHWHDKNLVWDPSKYGGLDQMHFGPDKIWAPKIYFLNSHDKDGTLFEHPTHHVVSNEGEVLYSTIASLSCQCKLDLVLFPSDKQRCEFPFAVFDLSPRDVNFRVNVNISNSNSTPVLSTEHGEWEVTNVQAGSRYDKNLHQERYVTATSIISFRRRPAFVYLNIYAPIFTIAVLCVLTFLVPVDSGERLAYALSMHLSFSVYIAFIGNILPMVSLGMPNVFYVVTALFFSSALCVAFSALNMALRWSVVTITKEGKKKIKILCFKLNLCKKGPSDPAMKRETKSNNKPAKRDNKRNLIRPLDKNVKKKDSKLFIVVPSETSVEQSIDENSKIEPDNMAKEDGHASSGQNINLESTSCDQKSPGILDPDLIKLCNRLDYFGFVLVSTIIVVVVIMTLLHRKWF